MGLLAKLGIKKPQQVQYNVKMIKPPESKEQVIPKYTLAWVEEVARIRGFEISDDTSKVNGILAALARRNGQCPCGGTGIQYHCPCIKMRERGICTCGLYKSMPPHKITGSSSASIDKE